MEISKVEGWLSLMGYEFCVWPYLGGVTASLKFRQFKSAVCDAFGVILCFGGLRGCSLLCRVQGALELLALILYIV